MKVKGNLRNTGEICMVSVADVSRDDGIAFIDLGNYYIDDAGRKCLVTSLERALKYGRLVDTDIYVFSKTLEDK